MTPTINEDVFTKEPIAVGYFTHDSKKALHWIQALASRKVKFTMTAYCEVPQTCNINYVFKIEPIPDEEIKKAIASIGLEHEYIIYKKKEKEW